MMAAEDVDKRLMARGASLAVLVNDEAQSIRMTRKANGTRSTGRVKRRVHGPMIGNALTLLWLEIDFAKPLNFFAEINSSRIQFRFQFVKSFRFNFLAHFRALVKLLERLLDFLPVVDVVRKTNVSSFNG